MNSITRELAVANLAALQEVSGQDYEDQQRALTESLDVQESGFKSFAEADRDACDNYGIVRSFVQALPAVESDDVVIRDFSSEIEPHVHAKSEAAARFILGHIVWRKTGLYDTYPRPYYVIGQSPAGALLLSVANKLGSDGYEPANNGDVQRAGRTRQVDAYMRKLAKSGQQEVTAEEFAQLYDPISKALLIHPKGNSRGLKPISDRALRLKPGLPNRIYSHEIRDYNVLQRLGTMAQMTGTIPDLLAAINSEATTDS